MQQMMIRIFMGLTLVSVKEVQTSLQKTITWIKKLGNRHSNGKKPMLKMKSNIGN
jgi:hypothetical protein